MWCLTPKQGEAKLHLELEHNIAKTSVLYKIIIQKRKKSNCVY